MLIPLSVITALGTTLLCLIVALVFGGKKDWKIAGLIPQMQTIFDLRNRITEMGCAGKSMTEEIAIKAASLETLEHDKLSLQGKLLIAEAAILSQEQQLNQMHGRPDVGPTTTDFFVNCDCRPWNDSPEMFFEWLEQMVRTANKLSKRFTADFSESGEPSSAFAEAFKQFVAEKVAKNGMDFAVYFSDGVSGDLASMFNELLEERKRALSLKQRTSTPIKFYRVCTVN